MTRILNYIKEKEIWKKSYVWLILILFYIPIIFGAFFSFNAPSKKGFISTTWNSFSFQAFRDLSTKNFASALVNSIIIALVTALIVIIISLITVFALWKQRNKTVKSYVNISSNIPLINPDVITAVAMAIILSLLFGTLVATKEGLLRSIVSHIVMTLPYGILLLYPRSEKFSKTLFEASQDLGYNKFKTWFLIYLKYMIPAIILASVVIIFLSFDDFIITKITSNAQTVGTLLYQGTFKTWALLLGAIMLTMIVIGNVIWIRYKLNKSKRGKNEI
ncbi:ABC transporter permease [Mesomycoplasma hyorhinis]|uniref:ABC transporter permease n=1 Tax=Mesomycoplasma hyorhinis TaxID=2100 RepID=UPI001C0574D9|nr:ABC transporter permease [Mesomycoplasma hyorhinis]